MGWTWLGPPEPPINRNFTAAREHRSVSTAQTSPTLDRIGAPPRLRVAVLGYGYWGPNLARNVALGAGTELVAIADVSADRLQRAATPHPLVALTTDFHAVLQDPAIDAVVIATPAATHFDLATEALESGKHVLVTKPLTTSVDLAERLVETAKRTGGTLLVDHTFLFTGAVRKMKDYLQQGVLGDLYYYDSVRINLGLFQSDANVVWDLAPHDISIMQFLVDEPVRSVSAIGSSHVGEMENIAYITLRFDSSVIAHFHVNWLAPAKVRRTVLGGSERMLVYGDLEPSEKLRLYDSGVHLAKSTDDVYRTLVEYRTGDVILPKLDQREALATECEHFARVVHGVEPAVSDAALGLEVVRIIEAAQQSMRRGGIPIEVER
jgi:predicted dehydrogenase